MDEKKDLLQLHELLTRFKAKHPEVPMVFGAETSNHEAAFYRASGRADVRVALAFNLMMGVGSDAPRHGEIKHDGLNDLYRYIGIFMATHQETHLVFAAKDPGCEARCYRAGGDNEYRVPLAFFLMLTAGQQDIVETTRMIQQQVVPAGQDPEAAKRLIENAGRG